MKNTLFLSAVLTLFLLGAGITSAQSPNSGVGVGVGTNVDVQVGNTNANANANANANVNAQANREDDEDDASEETRGNTSNSQGATQASDVSLKARQIRGWDPEQKEEFLSTVKAHAQLRSGQDLENFATGVLLRDEHVAAVEADEDEVSVTYKLPARFLGVFAAELSAVADVTFEAEERGKVPEEVKVKFPWYRMFFSLDEEARADVLETAIENSLSTNAMADDVYARSGQTIQLVSNIMKEIRLRLEANAEAEAEA